MGQAPSIAQVGSIGSLAFVAPDSDEVMAKLDALNEEYLMNPR